LMEFPVGRLKIFSFNLHRTTGHRQDLWIISKLVDRLSGYREYWRLRAI
jgi:hypothetical protein